MVERLEANPFGKLSYLGAVRSYIDQPGFPFQRAWNLTSKELLFYITMDQCLDNKWNIEADELNDPKDEDYVINNIIKDHEEIGKMHRET